MSWMDDYTGNQDDAILLFNEVNSPVERKTHALLTVVDRMNYLTEVGENALVDTKVFVEDLQDLLKTLEVPDIGDVDIDDVEIQEIDYNTRPKLDSLELEDSWPEENTDVLHLAPVTAADELDSVLFPSFNIEDPGFQEIFRPALIDIGAIEDAPTIADVDIPGQPELNLPEPPHLSTIQLPDAPEISIQPFDATLVPFDALEPGQFTWGEPVYHSDIWADLLGKVLDGIRNGGTGLAPDVEEAIYWNHLNRVFEEEERKIQETENYWAARGFTMPPGMLWSKVTQLNNESSRAKQQASNEVMVNQAELAQKNTHFFIEKGAELEGMMRDFFVKQATLSLEGQKTVAGYAMEIFNAQVARANYRLEEFKTRAAVWKSMVEAALVDVEIFKAKVEGAKVSAEVQQLLVAIYNAQVEAAETYVKMYSARMDGAKVEAEVQKTRMEIYSERIKAYLSKIEMNKALIGQYEAELGGEKTKADIYVAKVGAFEAETKAKSTELQAKIAKMTGQIDYNKALISEFEAKLSVYKTKVDVSAQKLGAKVEGFKAITQAYSAETERDSSYYKVKLSEISAKVQEANLRLQKGVAKVESALRGYQSIKEMQSKGLESIMGVGAQLAAASLQAISTSANIGYSGGDSYTASEGSSFSKNININRIEEE